MSALRLCLLLAPAALLASCGGDQSVEDDARSSSGEVLEGTISDAMLPVDTVQSQPPLLRRAPAAGDTAADEGQDENAGEGPDAGSETATPDAGATPAADPAGEAPAGAEPAEGA